MLERKQFGRLLKLTFYNYATKKKFTIKEDFKVSFSFNKSLDEIDTASTGEISIFGLTKETAYALGNRIGNTYQTEVEMSVGYKEDEENFQTLFYATVMSNSRVSSNEVKILVSANYQDFFLGDLKSLNLVDSNIGKVLENVETKFGMKVATNMVYNDKDYADKIKKIEVTNWSFNGSLYNYLDRVKRFYGITSTVKDLPNLSKVIVFGLDTDSTAFKTILKKVIESERDGNMFAADIDVSSYGVGNDEITSLYVSSDDKKVTVLDFDSGLLSYPSIKNKNVILPYDSKITKNESIIQKDPRTVRISKKTGEPIKDKVTGKVKLKIPKTMKINRRYVTIKALLNPTVKPQSLVKLSIGDSEVDGVYRVRNCKYSGDTYDGTWTMEAELEDTINSKPANDTDEIESYVESFEEDGITTLGDF